MRVLMNGLPPAQGLYDPSYEHDACGVGFICHIKGQPSHEIVSNALLMLENMNHRGACGCEENSGDGAGILIGIPDAFLRAKCKALGIELPSIGEYAVGTVFSAKDETTRRQCEAVFERVANEYDMVVLGWRDVPVDNSSIGPTPLRCEPFMRQVFVGMGKSFFNKLDFERRLYLVRQRAENTVEFQSPEISESAREEFYISALSVNRLVYKGMLTADQLRQYYPDLRDPEFTSPLAMVHSRFSTNTFPSWRLAHPFRMLAHNGEINTLRGNRNWMRARSASLKSNLFGDELPKLSPILTESGSDSATLDNALEFMVASGRDLPHAILMLIPEAWQKHELMDPDLRAFYEYHACLMEPWDGPASPSHSPTATASARCSIATGCVPSRYYVTKDDMVIMASEVGVLPVAPERVARKWRLQPGKIFLIDMKQGRIIDDREIKSELVDKPAVAPLA